MRMTQRESVGLSLALVILTAVAALAYRSIGAAEDTLGWAEHTHQVLAQMDQISGAFARAVTARRTFVVAGDPSQLGDAPELDDRLERAVAAGQALLADNPTQQRRLGGLSEMMRERVATLERDVERRRASGSAPETGQGILLTARIRDLREEITREENRLLGERYARTRRDLGRTRIAEVFGTLASFAILLFAFTRLRHEVARRAAFESSLRASERFLDSIVENIPDMIFVKDSRELRFERLNRAGEELLGLKRSELLGKSDHDFFPAEQAAFFQKLDRETLANGVVVDIQEEPIQTARGERWLHTKKVPVMAEDGSPRYLLGISEDITERRKGAAALKAAKDAAEAANRELEAFSYSVAHDLRAPLRSIDGFSLALQEDIGPGLDAASADHLRRVRAAAQQMSQLIDGLLGLSRLSRGALVREKVDLTRLAREAAARQRDAHPQQKVELVVEEGLETEGDPRLLASVMENLVGNAWKFTSKRAAARVEVGRGGEDGKRFFFVRDNGAGFDQAYADKLFGAFQRLHSKAEFDGTGIGLATVQRIVARHGGRVWAEGEVGRGATLYFSL